jgi:hypothetical protein
LRGEFLKLVEAAQRLTGEPVGMLPPAWRVETAARVVQASQFQPATQLRCPVEPSWSGQLASRFKRSFSSLTTTHIFLLGAFAGVAAAIGALAVGVRLGQCRVRPAEVAATKACLAK